ncbi:MAG: hypothetical protein HDT28_00745 [Clostridiales bacterium]|nr:hypothetical protein [Clostridiales bacterium]
MMRFFAIAQNTPTLRAGVPYGAKMLLQASIFACSAGRKWRREIDNVAKLFG